MATSDLVLQDIKSIVLKLASDEGSTGENPWLYSVQKLLMGLLPIVISIEQAGKNVSPSSFMTLDSLEHWMLDVEGNADLQGSKRLLWDLKQFLAILPGYKKDLIGKQEPWTQEKYVYHIIMARSLCDAAKSYQPRSLGTCNIAPMCDDLVTTQV